MIKNTSTSYGLMSIILHWVSALAIFGMFALGLYMVELTYYDEYYRTAPFIHKSVGILLILLVIFRLVWKVFNPKVRALESHTAWEVKLAHLVHGFLYVLLFVIACSGYLISTADGNSVEVFGWFEVPSVVEGIDNLEDYAGEVHEVSVWIMMCLVGLHVAGGLKHWLIDKDKTLQRMLVSSKK